MAIVNFQVLTIFLCFFREAKSKEEDEAEQKQDLEEEIEEMREDLQDEYNKRLEKYKQDLEKWKKQKQDKVTFIKSQFFMHSIPQHYLSFALSPL